jgi:hypothetical protein
MIRELRDLLKEQHLREAKNGEILLDERDRSGRMKVSVTGISDGVIALTKLSHSRLIDDTKKGRTQICDYILFIPHAPSQYYAVFCELKQTAISLKRKNQGCTQISCTRPLLPYLKRMLIAHFDKQIKFFERYAVIFGGGDLDKQGVSPQTIEQHKYSGIQAKIIPPTKAIPYNKLL